MATTPKGNFMAFQPLKPTEYKVGDIYSNMIDGMIKRGEAEKAAELKAAQERQFLQVFLVAEHQGDGAGSLGLGDDLLHVAE